MRGVRPAFTRDIRMDKTIYMIRHGQISANVLEIYAGRSDDELTPVGVEQADRLGREIEQWGVSSIYTSPLARTIQTARILNEYADVRMILEPDLIEMDLGPWTGLSKKQVAVRYPDEFRVWWNTPAAFRADGMETLARIQERAVMASERFLRNGLGRACAMVTHAAVIKCAFLYFNDLPLDDYHSIPVHNVSVFQIIFQGGKSSMFKIR